MEIASVYKLPMTAEEHIVYTDDYRYKIKTDSSDTKCEPQARAIAMALNNHDALVFALEESNRLLGGFTEHSWVREKRDENFKLLDSIKAT